MMFRLEVLRTDGENRKRESASDVTQMRVQQRGTTPTHTRLRQARAKAGLHTRGIGEEERLNGRLPVAMLCALLVNPRQFALRDSHAAMDELGHRPHEVPFALLPQAAPFVGPTRIRSAVPPILS